MLFEGTIRQVLIEILPWPTKTSFEEYSVSNKEDSFDFLYIVVYLQASPYQSKIRLKFVSTAMSPNPTQSITLEKP